MESSTLRHRNASCDYRALQALPAALDTVKLRGRLTGTGSLIRAGRAGMGQQPEGHGGQACRSQVQTQLWLKVVAVLPCLLLIKSPGSPTSSICSQVFD